MITATFPGKAMRTGVGGMPRVGPNDEARVSVDSACSAFHMNRALQPGQLWACHESGPIRLVGINGLLARRSPSGVESLMFARMLAEVLQ